MKTSFEENLNATVEDSLYPTFKEWKHLDIHVFGNIKVIHIAHRNWSTILDKPFYINSNLNS